jgi:hypothetical protein
MRAQGRLACVDVPGPSGSRTAFEAHLYGNCLPESALLEGECFGQAFTALAKASDFFQVKNGDSLRCR